MDVDSKSNAPILIIVVCASFTMLVQTISSAITVMGYDDVIRADAEARAAQILQKAKPNKALELKYNQLEHRLEEVEKLAHNSGEQ